MNGTCQKHNVPFVLGKGCDQCLAERRITGTPTPDAAAELYFTPPDTETAGVMPVPEDKGLDNSNTFIMDVTRRDTTDFSQDGEGALALRPGADIEVMSYHEEAQRLLQYAEDRVIKTVEDNEAATGDLAFIRKLKKAMEAKQKERLDPLEAEKVAIRETYDFLMEPVLKADRITSIKMTEFKLEEERKARAAEELNRRALEVAQEQAAMNNGEFSVDITPVNVPVAPRLTRTDQGTSGLVANWKYEIIDITLLPREYMIPNDAMLKTIAKQQHDQNPVPGVRFYNDPYTAVRTK